MLPMIDYSKIEYFVIDVDGTMTDAGIYYDDAGNELKKVLYKRCRRFFHCTCSWNEDHCSDWKRMQSSDKTNAGNERRVYFSEYKRQKKLFNIIFERTWN